MARIPDSELERIKGQVSLARLIRGPGHPARLAGKDLACRCPWHEGDDTPSCVVTPKTNLWHCAIPAGQADADQALLDQVIGFYHQTLKASPEALAYLEHRGLAAWS